MYWFITLWDDSLDNYPRNVHKWSYVLLNSMDSKNMFMSIAQMKFIQLHYWMCVCVCVYMCVFVGGLSCLCVTDSAKAPSVILELTGA